MQYSMIPWHVFMNALAEQRRAPAKNWLDRWRFTNDGVFMAHELSEGKHGFHLTDGSITDSGNQEPLVN